MMLRPKPSVNFTQSCPDTPGQTDKKPFLIPIKLGLLGSNGEELALNSGGDGTTVIALKEQTQTLVFDNIDQQPVPSLLRGFSAPVKLTYNYSPEELAHLMAHDSDGFNRWDAGQSLSFIELDKLIKDQLNQRQLQPCEHLIKVFGHLLSDTSLDPAMVNLMLQLPSEAQLHERAEVIEVEAIHKARQFARASIAKALQPALIETYQRLTETQDYAPEAEQIGRRALRNCALSYLMLIDDVGPELAWQQFNNASNMTDRAAALASLVNCPAAENYAAQALEQFQQQFNDEALVMNLWLQIQATNSQPNGLARVKELMTHPAYSATNPNKIRSLVGAFCSANPINFHNSDGSGYQFLQEQIIALNKVNPQVAARLVTPLTKWKKLAEPNKTLMHNALSEIAKQEDLVVDVREIVIKSL